MSELVGVMKCSGDGRYLAACEVFHRDMILHITDYVSLTADVS